MSVEELPRLRCRAGEYIHREGEAGVPLSIIESGEVAILKRVGEEEVQLALLARGDVVGQPAGRHPALAATSACAVEETTLLRIDPPQLDGVLAADARVGGALIERLARQRDELVERLARWAAARPARGHPAAGPVPLAAEGSAPGDDGRTVRWKLVHPSSGRELTLPEGAEITLGRSDPSSGVTPDLDFSPLEAGHTISRRHARLRRRDHQLVLREEANVANGTFLNGERLAPGREVEVHEGDELRLGMVTVLLRTA